MRIKGVSAERISSDQGDDELRSSTGGKLVRQLVWRVEAFRMHDLYIRQVWAHNRIQFLSLVGSDDDSDLSFIVAQQEFIEFLPMGHESVSKVELAIPPADFGFPIDFQVFDTAEELREELGAECFDWIEEKGIRLDHAPSDWPAPLQDREHIHACAPISSVEAPVALTIACRVLPILEEDYRLLPPPTPRDKDLSGQRAPSRLRCSIPEPERVWIYINSNPSKPRQFRMTVHAATCRNCNDGTGVGGCAPRLSPTEVRGIPDAAWIGPFRSIAAANGWAMDHPSVGRSASRCSNCNNEIPWEEGR
jgi:hypothetical protein